MLHVSAPFINLGSNLLSYREAHTQFPGSQPGLGCAVQIVHSQPFVAAVPQAGQHAMPQRQQRRPHVYTTYYNSCTVRTAHRTRHVRHFIHCFNSSTSNFLGCAALNSLPQATTTPESPKETHTHVVVMSTSPAWQRSALGRQR